MARQEIDFVTRNFILVLKYQYTMGGKVKVYLLSFSRALSILKDDGATPEEEVDQRKGLKRHLSKEIQPKATATTLHI